MKIVGLRRWSKANPAPDQNYTDKDQADEFSTPPAPTVRPVLGLPRALSDYETPR